MSYVECPCCGGNRRKETKVRGVVECVKCGAVYGDCYLGESYEFVLPYFVNEEPPAESTRYFDFVTLGSKGIDRRHGWFDPSTRRIVQVG